MAPYIGGAAGQSGVAVRASVGAPTKLGMAKGVGRCGASWRTSRTGWFIKARSRRVDFILAIFGTPWVFALRSVSWPREGKGACLGASWCRGEHRGERRGSGEVWSRGNAGASSAASGMADRTWARPQWLYHSSSLVGAGAGSGGGVLGILQTRRGDEGWPLAGCPRRGGNGCSTLFTIEGVARAGEHGAGVQ
jgi:hypothetical protein